MALAFGRSQAFLKVGSLDKLAQWHCQPMRKRAGIPSGIHRHFSRRRWHTGPIIALRGHSNNGSGDAEMGKNMYPPAPDMRQPDTQKLSDGELFYIIQNGIRLTGMPSWGSGVGHDDQDSWKLVRFIRHLPKLTAGEEQEMEMLNPKSPDELKEEQEEKEFLNGGQSHEQKPHEHDH
jgi:hypothetical protein